MRLPQAVPPADEAQLGGTAVNTQCCSPAENIYCCMSWLSTAPISQLGQSTQSEYACLLRMYLPQQSWEPQQL